MSGAAPFRNAAAVGLDESRLGRVPDIDALGLVEKAVDAALADAGLLPAARSST